MVFLFQFHVLYDFGDEFYNRLRISNLQNIIQIQRTLIFFHPVFPPMLHFSLYLLCHSYWRMLVDGEWLHRLLILHHHIILLLRLTASFNYSWTLNVHFVLRKAWIHYNISFTLLFHHFALNCWIFGSHVWREVSDALPMTFIRRSTRRLITPITNMHRRILLTRPDGMSVFFVSYFWFLVSGRLFGLDWGYLSSNHRRPPIIPHNILPTTPFSSLCPF